MQLKLIPKILGLAFAGIVILGFEQPPQKLAANDVNTAKNMIENAKQDVKSLINDAEAEEIAIDAYIYTYPLVTMEYTRRVMTNVTTPAGSKAPMGQFAKLRNYPAVDDHSVTAPNADTLYTIAWFDLSNEPWIIKTPDMKDRYYLLPILDSWTTVFANPGKRTTGSGPLTFAITGPNWKGTLPRAYKNINHQPILYGY